MPLKHGILVRVQTPQPRRDSEAEKAAKRFSANSGGGEVKVHSPNDPIRDSDTIEPDNDPNPPRDKRH